MSHEEQTSAAQQKPADQRHRRLWQRLLLGIVCLLGGLGLWLGGYELAKSSVETNLWSVQYLWQHGQQAQARWLPATLKNAPPPAQHQSAQIWQARELLKKGQVLQAQTTLAPRVAQGDHEALRLQAEILAAGSAIPAAVQVWTQIGAVDDLLAIARQMVQAQQPTAALNAYRAAYSLAPEMTVLPLSHFLRQQMHDSASAETLLRQYITAMPRSRYFVSWLRELGDLYRDQKAWAEAIALYSQLVVAMPDSAADWVQLGWVYYEQGAGAEKALAQFQQAVKITPQEGVGYYAIGALLSKEKRYPEADPWFAQALEHEPEQRAWWLARAGAVQQTGNRAVALQLYATMQQRFPDFAQGHYQAAWVYRQAEDRKAAVAAIEQALQAMASSGVDQVQTQASYYARAGQIYEWAGQLPRAVAAYEEATRLDPQQQDAQEGLARLR